MFGKEAKQILADYGAYPTEKRNKLTLDEVKKITSQLYNELEEEKEKNEKCYTIEGQQKCEVLMQALNYIKKRQDNLLYLFGRNYGKDMCGPSPK